MTPEERRTTTSVRKKDTLRETAHWTNPPPVQEYDETVQTHGFNNVNTRTKSPAKTIGLHRSKRTRKREKEKPKKKRAMETQELGQEEEKEKPKAKKHRQGTKMSSANSAIGESDEEESTSKQGEEDEPWLEAGPRAKNDRRKLREQSQDPKNPEQNQLMNSTYTRTLV